MPAEAANENAPMQIIAFLSLCLPNLHPYEILAMDALFAYALVAQRAKLRDAAAPTRPTTDEVDGKWKLLPGGKREMRITSAASLKNLFNSPLGKGDLKL